MWFYTGLPDPAERPGLHRMWIAKLSRMQRAGVTTWTGHRRPRPRELRCDKCGHEWTVAGGAEKGTDLRLALDAVAGAREQRYDVAVIVSTDQDFHELVKELKQIGASQRRTIHVASAFPRGAQRPKAIAATEKIPIGQAEYESCCEESQRPFR